MKRKYALSKHKIRKVVDDRHCYRQDSIELTELCWKLAKTLGYHDGTKDLIEELPTPLELVDEAIEIMSAKGKNA